MIRFFLTPSNQSPTSGAIWTDPNPTHFINQNISFNYPIQNSTSPINNLNSIQYSTSHHTPVSPQIPPDPTRINSYPIPIQPLDQTNFQTQPSDQMLTNIQTQPSELNSSIQPNYYIEEYEYPEEEDLFNDGWVSWDR